MEQIENYAFLCLDYCSVYGGNFIPTLISISKKKKNTNFIYFLSKKAENRKWIKKIKENGGEIIFIDTNKNMIKQVVEIKKYIKENNIKLVHSHFTSMKIVSFLSLILKNTKVIIHIHSNWDAGKKNLKSKLIDIKQYVIYNIIGYKAKKIAVSKEISQKYNTYYVPNAIANERIKEYSKKEIEDLKVKYNCNDGINILILAWHPYIKGLDILAEVVGKLNEKYNKKINLLIVCGEKNKQDIKEYIDSKCNYKSSSNFYIYLKPIENVFEYHNIADIFVSASRSEGFSYGVLEALSIGKCTVTSNILGTSWATKYGAKTFISEDVNECYKCIDKIINKKKYLIKNDTKLIREELGIERFTNEIEKIYNE